MKVSFLSLLILLAYQPVMASTLTAAVQCAADGPVYQATVKIPDLTSDWSHSDNSNICQLNANSMVVISFNGFTYSGVVEPKEFERVWDKTLKRYLTCEETYAKHGFEPAIGSYQGFQVELRNQNGFIINTALGAFKPDGSDFNPMKLNPPKFLGYGSEGSCSIGY